MAGQFEKNQLSFVFTGLAPEEHSMTLEELKESLENAKLATIEDANAPESGEDTPFVSEDGHLVYIVPREKAGMARGAPAVGMTDIAKTFNFQRSFIYAPLSAVEGNNIPFSEDAIQIGRTFAKKGFNIFNDLDEDQYPSQIHFVNGGVTQGFNKVLMMALEAHEAIKLAYLDPSTFEKPAVLVPVPTYGLFYDVLKKLRDAGRISILPVRRDQSGAVNLDSLKFQIKTAHDENMKIISYYDHNPHNPTGHVRTWEETKALGAVLEKLNRYYIDLHDQRCEGDFFRAENSKYYMRAALCEQAPWYGTLIIDDLAYDGLQYDASKEVYSLAQVSDELAHQTAVLFSVSKVGAPSLRAGMVIGQHAMIGALNTKQIHEEFSASSFAVDALKARFGVEGDNNVIAGHANILRRIHAFNAKLFEAFIVGLDGVGDLTEIEKNIIVRQYARYKKIEKTEAREILSQKLDLFTPGPRPEAGFFHNINFDKCPDFRFLFKVREKDGSLSRRYGANAARGNGVCWALNVNGIESVPAEWMGYIGDSKTLRFSFSYALPKMFRFYDRLREAHAFFKSAEETPDYQSSFFSKGLMVSP